MHGVYVMGLTQSTVSANLRKQIQDDHVEYTNNELNILYAHYKAHVAKHAAPNAGDMISFGEMLANVAELQNNPLRRRILWVFTCETNTHYPLTASFPNDRMDSIPVGFHVYAKMLYAFSNLAPVEMKSYFLFRIYDWDGDGVLSVSDMQHVLSIILEKGFDDPDVKDITYRILDEGDLNGNNQLSLDEFRDVLDDIPEFANAFTMHIRAF